MTKRTIVTCYPLSDQHAEQIRHAAGDEFEVIVSSQEKIGADLLAADVFCGHAKTPVDWPAVVKAGRLKWIQSSAAGLDHCLTPAVIDSEILVSGCSGLFASQVAETTVALLTGLTRSLPVFFRAQQRKEYVRRPTDHLIGKTIGIVGFGGNGQRIAKVLRPMVNKIIATDVFYEHCQSLVTEGLVEQVLAAEKLDEMLPLIDVLIVTLPLTDSNDDSIGDVQFQKTLPGTIFINVGRGSVVNTDSLIRYLDNGHLAGAGIDVVQPEPLPIDSPLWDFDNVIITPHIGAQSKFRIPSSTDLFCKNIPRYLNGQTLLNWVDKGLGFPRPEHRIQF